mgnify:CR=1 FL=1
MNDTTISTVPFERRFNPIKYALFHMPHHFRRCVEEFHCPRNCGTLEFKKGTGKVREGINGYFGVGMTFVSIITTLSYMSWIIFVEGRIDDPFMLLLVIFFVVMIFYLGLKIGVGETWNYHCSECNGVLINSEKVIEKFHKDDAKKILLMIENNQKESLNLCCPKCKENMDFITVNYVTKVTSAFAKDFENMPINFCERCSILWFDNQNIEILATSLITDEV